MLASNAGSGVARRRFLKGALAAVAGGLLVPAVSGRSWAVQSLPAIGQRVDLSVNVFGAVMTSGLHSGEHTLDFVGRRVVEVQPGGADFVRLRTLDFAIEASHPLFGKVTMTLPEFDVSPASTLRVTRDGVTETWYQASVITFERAGEETGPFVLGTDEPLKATATMHSWPPPAQGTNPDGSPTGGALYAAVQSPTFTEDDLRVDFTAFAPNVGELR